ncbi:MAG: N-(5'-phosphoribosyl)anthranilate isomerase [Candidatus Magasanikbacteria bacterium CG_4_10_14_0_2_um_filter_37_12]|uniref:N-(5'-phosphoribosyl)anthranilate isomerase n=1 Tax=Candidatus Magasanikbacteria bacterium CG_4_10_14_0_2_um_filter_37_12 TaxID=1974637 RepID=A0A2M7V6T0_9BACT|nr:MAG: N-(5'-phosphoribosyl)anthranilate isomerase [Candidatus Magasanikbacteria bacterium CG_4_10_14_0_2_um_filter_37_12]
MKIDVKICGITSREDAFLATSAGATHLGFVIGVPESKRNMNREDATDIVQYIKSEYSGIICVGVFVDKIFEDVVNIVRDCKLDVVQLHGDESTEFCQKLRNFVKVYKAIIIKSKKDLSLIKKYEGVVDRILLDAGHGSGEQIDFDLLEGVEVDILAGGISPDNVLEIVGNVRPKMIDVSGGVELFPGRKSKIFIQKLFTNIINCN